MTTQYVFFTTADFILRSMPVVEADAIQSHQLQKHLKQCEVALAKLNQSLEKAELISEDYYTLQSQKIALYHLICEIKEQL